MARSFSKADRGIHQVKGLAYGEVAGLIGRVNAARKVSKRDKALRSIARECRLWLKANEAAKPRIYASQVSQQDGLSAEKIIVATV
jgi:alkylated DNA nucleotide flippase Atl1